MKTAQVYHLNQIGHEINESLTNDYPSSDREIFCKRLHKITEPMQKDCSTCPYFAGLMMGYGHECKWEDVVDEGDEGQFVEKLVPHQDVKKELYRVSKLIDQGIIKKY